MPYVSFSKYFPDLAQKETRWIIAVSDPDLPTDKYGLIELYCDEENCDCRRVFLNVISEKTGRTLALINYGWESREYYVRWMGDDDPLVIEDLKGPTLNISSPHSGLAHIFLERVKQYVLKDSAYIERLKRHYDLFKEVIEKQAQGKRSLSDGNRSEANRSKKVGRNDPCPCGSGKKFKKCCIGKNQLHNT